MSDQSSVPESLIDNVVATFSLPPGSDRRRLSALVKRTFSSAWPELMYEIAFAKERDLAQKKHDRERRVLAFRAKVREAVPDVPATIVDKLVFYVYADGTLAHENEVEYCSNVHGEEEFSTEFTLRVSISYDPVPTCTGELERELIHVEYDAEHEVVQSDEKYYRYPPRDTTLRATFPQLTTIDLPLTLVDDFIEACFKTAVTLELEQRQADDALTIMENVVDAYHEA